MCNLLPFAVFAAPVHAIQPFAFISRALAGPTSYSATSSISTCLRPTCTVTAFFISVSRVVVCGCNLLCKATVQTLYMSSTFFKSQKKNTRTLVHRVRAKSPEFELAWPYQCLALPVQRLRELHSFAFQIVCKFSSSALRTGGMGIASILSIDASSAIIVSLIVPWLPP